MEDWIDNVYDGLSDIKNDFKEKCFHSISKEKIIEELKCVELDFNSACCNLNNSYNNLNDIREDSIKEIMPLVYDYINILASSPKKLNDAFIRLNHEVNTYNKTKNNNYGFKTSYKNEDYRESIIVGSGFLYGALADNLVVPVLGTVIALGLKARRNNKECIDESIKNIKEYKENIAKIEIHIKEIDNIIATTKKFRREILKLVAYLQNTAPKNYLEFNQEQKNYLTALVNNTNSFSQLLNQSV